MGSKLISCLSCLSECTFYMCDGVCRSISEGESGSPPHTEFTGEPPEVDSRYVIKPHAEKLRRVSTGCMKLEDEGAALGAERSLHPTANISSEQPTCFPFRWIWITFSYPPNMEGCIGIILSVCLSLSGQHLVHRSTSFNQSWYDGVLSIMRQSVLHKNWFTARA